MSSNDSSSEAHIQRKHPGILSDTCQTSYLVTAEEMQHFNLEVKHRLESVKLSKSGILVFGGNCGPNKQCWADTSVNVCCRPVNCQLVSMDRSDIKCQLHMMMNIMSICALVIVAL